MDIITRDELIQFIKEWADNHPGKDGVIKNALGSSGGSWTNGDYNDGMISIIEGMVRAINEKVKVKLADHRAVVKELRDQLEVMRSKLGPGGQWLDALTNRINWCITQINTFHGTQQTQMNLDTMPDVLPDIPEI